MREIIILMESTGGKKLNHCFIMAKRINGKQLRMARISLKWRVDDLAKKTGLTWARIQTFERSDDFLEDNNKSQKLIEIFNNHKIEFVDETDKHEPTILIKK